MSIGIKLMVIEKSAFISARIEPNVKKQANKILNELGINSSQAIIMLYEYIIYAQRLPTELKIPDTKTRKTFKQKNKNIDLVKFKDTKELSSDLGI